MNIYFYKSSKAILKIQFKILLRLFFLSQKTKQKNIFDNSKKRKRQFVNSHGAETLRALGLDKFMFMSLVNIH